MKHYFLLTALTLLTSTVWAAEQNLQQLLACRCQKASAYSGHEVQIVRCARASSGTNKQNSTEWATYDIDVTKLTPTLQFQWPWPLWIETYRGTHSHVVSTAETSSLSLSHKTVFVDLPLFTFAPRNLLINCALVAGATAMYIRHKNKSNHTKEKLNDTTLSVPDITTVQLKRLGR